MLETVPSLNGINFLLFFWVFLPVFFLFVFLLLLCVFLIVLFGFVFQFCVALENINTSLCMIIRCSIFYLHLLCGSNRSTAFKGQVFINPKMTGRSYYIN